MLKIVSKGAQLSRVTSKASTINSVVSASFVVPRIFQNISLFNNNGSSQRLPILGFRSFNETSQSRGPRPPRKVISSPVIMVRGLPWDRYHDSEIRKVFPNYEIAKTNILTDANGKATGYIFVEFGSVDEAARALRSSRNLTVDDRSVFLRSSSHEEREQAIDDHQRPSLVVALRKIPYSASEAEIRSIFDDVKIEAMVVGNGSAFIRVATKEDLENAMKKNGIEFFRRKLLISTGSDFDFRLAEARPPRVVRIRGAPNTSTEEDFRQFFKDFEVQSVVFTTKEGISGRQIPGDVFVEFGTAEDLEKALQLDRQNMGERYLQLFKSSYRERRARLAPPNPNFRPNRSENPNEGEPEAPFFSQDPQ